VDGVIGRGDSDPFGISAVTTIDQWYHAALVVEDVAGGLCTGEFFVDGVYQTTESPPPDQPRHSGPLLGANLGSYKDGTKDFLPGTLDDLRIYDRVLTDAEIDFLAGLAGSDPGNPWLWYKFDEVAGLVANNSGTSKVDGIYFPILSPANVIDTEPKDSRKVNFRDYAKIAEHWLEEVFWP